MLSCVCVFSCLSLPVMLRAVLNKAAVESARQPAIKTSPTTTTGTPSRTPSTPASLVSPVNSTHHSSTLPLQSSALAERGVHNPMLTSLLESDAMGPGSATELFDSLRQKRVIGTASDLAAMKRQSSVDDVYGTGTAATRSAALVNMTPPISRSFSVPASVSPPRPSIKLEPASSLVFSNLNQMVSTPVDHVRTPKSSTSELVSLLSSDDFSGGGANASNSSVENQLDFNTSSKSLPFMSADGKTSAAGMSWSCVSDSDVGMDWETLGTTSDDLRQSKSAASKNGQMMRNSLSAGSSGIKTELATVHDGATAGLVSAAPHNKPPITVKLSRVQKQSSQRRATPDVKERGGKTSHGPKLNSSVVDSLSSEVDVEVDSLTSTATSVSSTSPGRASASPRLTGDGIGPSDVAKVGEKRQRLVGGSKAVGMPAEKKRRSDEGRKMSRKIYEFDDDNDVFVNAGGGGQSGRISTIKITKSEGRLQIQKSGTMAGLGSRPLHKSMSCASGQVSGSTVRLGRPPGFPLRPVVRSKSLVTPKSDSKAIGLPRVKPSLTAVNSATVVPAVSAAAKPPVSNATKSATNSTTAVTKSKSVQPPAKRKGSLTAVIEKLREGVSAGAEPDKKVLYDDIRLAIIREGNKPSTPTRELSSSSSSLSLSKSSMSATKRPSDIAKEPSVRLAVPVRKLPVPIPAGSQLSEVGRGPVAMVRFTAPPASPPTTASDHRSHHPQQSDVHQVPKIPRDQTIAVDKHPGGLQSLRPSISISRTSDAEAVEASRLLSQPVIRMIRPPVSGTVLPARASPVTSETSSRAKTPDVARRGDQLVDASDDVSDRLQPARHFLDAMAHRSRVCDSSVVIERRLSPPRSPSPPHSTVASGTVDLTRPKFVDDSGRSSSEVVSGSVCGTPEPSNVPVDLSSDTRQHDSSAVHFRTPSDVSLRSSSTRSPSATGSPVASLIIDCYPGSPVLMSASTAVSSPVATSVSDAATSVPSDVDESSRAEMCRRQSASPTMSVGDTSATDIDDDLMNEALIMSADVSNEQLGKL